MDLKKALDAILYFVCIPYVAISFVLCKLTNDTRIFIGVEAIADNYYPLPYGWDAAYEVKPIGNRMLNWVLYKVADFFVPFETNQYDHFGIAVRITALIILIFCCWYISKRIQFPYAFPILFLSFACQASFGVLMSEWFAVLFSLVAIAMCMEKDSRWLYVAGALCICIGLLKSITLLMVIPILCAVYLLGKDIDLKKFAVGYFAAGISFLILCFTIWPYSIGDMLMSRLVAHVGMYDPLTLMQWFWMTQARSNLPTVLSMYVPALVVAAVIAVLVFVGYYAKSRWKNIAAFLVMWGVPTIIVLVQSEFIIYHYIVLLLPAIVSMILFARMWTVAWTKAVWGCFAFILISYIFINSAAGSFTEFEYTFWHQKEINANIINEQFNLTNQSELLYLDPGDAPYYFHANSSCHYIAPMPVERSTERWNMTDLPQYSDTMNCILSYQGEYIVSDIDNGFVTGFFGEGIRIRKEITDMISRNYSKVESKSWTIYKKRI